MAVSVQKIKDKLDALTKVSEGVYKMHGLLYEDETLQLAGSSYRQKTGE